jgi:trans-aconitate methyltransferase
MELTTAISLIKPAISKSQNAQKWMELGSGKGLFTAALSQVVPSGSTILAIDKSSPEFGDYAFNAAVEIEQIELDFIKARLPQGFDGVLMANSLHFVENKKTFFQSLRHSMSRHATLIIVEYDTNHGNQWVPYPVSFETLKYEFQADFQKIEKIGHVQSVFQKGGIYSATLLSI